LALGNLRGQLVLQLLHVLGGVDHGPGGCGLFEGGFDLGDLDPETHDVVERGDLAAVGVLGGVQRVELGAGGLDGVEVRGRTSAGGNRLVIHTEIVTYAHRVGKPLSN